jgi:hypothetical protein
MAEKKVDESWKQQVEAERHIAGPGPGQESGPGPGLVTPAGPGAGSAPHREPTPPVQPADPVEPIEAADAASEAPDADVAQPGASESGMPEARFDMFITGLAVDALISLGDMDHPTTHRRELNLEHARYLIDLLGVLEEKTRKNLNANEERLLKDTLYQLRMRYLAKTGGAA